MNSSLRQKHVGMQFIISVIFNKQKKNQVSYVITQYGHFDVIIIAGPQPKPQLYFLTMGSYLTSLDCNPLNDPR